MNFVLQPWHLMVVFLASWINRQQQEVIEYLRTENQVLKEKIGKKRIQLNDDQRRRLAAATIGSQKKDSWPKATRTVWYSVFAGHHPSLAPTTGRQQMRLLRSIRKETGTAENTPSDCRPDREVRQRKSNVGIRSDSGRTLSPRAVHIQRLASSLPQTVGHLTKWELA